MRVLVFFDLPVVRKTDRRAYTQFRKFLIKDGYEMLQYSVYCRICNGLDNVDTHMKRLKKSLPVNGAVRAMVITEKQFQNMKILVGKIKKKEKTKTPVQLSLF